MDPYVSSWLNLVVRWIHVIAGAAWIGASFYFNWLNNSLRPPNPPRKGIGGQLIAVHGGAFYEVLKYAGAPDVIPRSLHWFKWEAYLTWLSGISLLIIVYYMNAEVYLVDRSVADISAVAAVGIGVGALVGGWIVYDLMCKSPLRHRPVAFATVGFVLATAAAWGLCQVFGSRAAYIHVGAMLGTMMAANVFFVIIPNQRKMVDARLIGREPVPEDGAAASLRSLHNNYLTLPVLFIMVSGHFPMTYGHDRGWLILAALSLIGAGVRHFFNLKGKGQLNVWILPAATVAMFALAFVSAPAQPKALIHPEPVSADRAYGIIAERCVPCHSATPSHPAFPQPPAGLVYDTPEQVKELSARIMNVAVEVKSMPLGNLTKMTDEERAMVGRWIQDGAPLD